MWYTLRIIVRIYVYLYYTCIYIYMCISKLLYDGELGWKNIHPLSERLVSFGIMGAQLKTPQYVRVL